MYLVVSHMYQRLGNWNPSLKRKCILARESLSKLFLLDKNAHKIKKERKIEFDFYSMKFNINTYKSLSQLLIFSPQIKKIILTETQNNPCFCWTYEGPPPLQVVLPQALEPELVVTHGKFSKVVNNPMVGFLYDLHSMPLSAIGVM